MVDGIHHLHYIAHLFFDTFYALPVLRYQTLVSKNWFMFIELSTMSQYSCNARPFISTVFKWLPLSFPNCPASKSICTYIKAVLIKNKDFNSPTYETTESLN